MNIKNYFWVLPFICFAAGYEVTKWIICPDIITVPSCIGKPIHEILPSLSSLRLNIRLIDQKEDETLPEGIVLSQRPSAGTLVKPHQSFFITTTKKPNRQKAHACIGMHKNNIEQLFEHTDINPHFVILNHSYPENKCFAQSPHAGEPMEKNKITLYISHGNDKPILWPNFINHSVEYAQEFLQYYDIEPHIIGNNITEMSIVIDQRPHPNTIVSLSNNKKPSVQLRVS